MAYVELAIASFNFNVETIASIENMSTPNWLANRSMGLVSPTMLDVRRHARMIIFIRACQPKSYSSSSLSPSLSPNTGTPSSNVRSITVAS